MRWLLLLAIRVYWRVPTRLHAKCIFRESCSHYVYRITSEQGFRSGIRAFFERKKECRPGYVLYKFEGHFFLKAASGQTYSEEHIALSLLPPNDVPYIDFDAKSK